MSSVSATAPLNDWNHTYRAVVNLTFTYVRAHWSNLAFCRVCIGLHATARLRYCARLERISERRLYSITALDHFLQLTINFAESALCKQYENSLKTIESTHRTQT